MCAKYHGDLCKIEGPQGSVLGLILFTFYTTPLRWVVHDSVSGISNHLYADDTQIYISLTPENATTALRTLRQCTSAEQSWMTHNQLKLNPHKTELLLIGTKWASLAHLFPD